MIAVCVVLQAGYILAWYYRQYRWSLSSRSFIFEYGGVGYTELLKLWLPFSADM